MTAIDEVIRCLKSDNDELRKIGTSEANAMIIANQDYIASLEEYRKKRKVWRIA